MGAQARVFKCIVAVSFALSSESLTAESMVKREITSDGHIEVGSDIFIVAPDGVCHGLQIAEPLNVDLTDEGETEDVDMRTQAPKRRCLDSPRSTAASTP